MKVIELQKIQMSSIVLCLILAYTVLGQDIDTVKVEKIIQMEVLVDSLRRQIRNMDSEIQRMKREMVENATDVRHILSFFDEEVSENIPEERRSRRRRVDALLKAITEQPGQLRFNGSTVVSMQSVLNSNSGSSNAVGSFDLFAHTSFGEQTLLFFDFEVVGGNGPLVDSSIFSPTNGDAGSTQSPDGLDRIHLLEAWAEFYLFRKTMTVDIGKIDLTNYFDNNRVANDETSQYLGAAFINSAALAAPGNGPGIRVRTTVFDLFFIQVGMANTDNSSEHLFHQLFKIGSVGFRLFSSSMWEANIRVYGFQHPDTSLARGWGISFDQALGNQIEIFARWGKNSVSLSQRHGIASAWSAGAVYSHTLAGHKVKSGGAIGSSVSLHNTTENHFEIYSRIQLNQWSYISAHFQSVASDEVIKQRFNLLGLRVNIYF